MVAASMTEPNAAKPRWRAVALVLLWTGVGVGALLLLAKSVQNSGEFSRLQPWILLLNLLGVVALTTLLARKITQLVRDYRVHVPGSRLTARTVGIFGALVVTPLLIVYLCSLQFLDRGIDSWFHVEVKQGLSDALVLSRAALDLRVREYSRHTENLAHSLADAPAEEIARRIYEERRATAALEMTVFGAHIWISYSPDLRHWGSHKMIMQARRGGWWDANKIGLSPPPIETSKGWLMIYHGVRQTPSGCLYRLGLALFDRETPERCLRRGDTWIFGPEEPYEREGDVGNVVFPCGYTVAPDGDTVNLYYGAADTCVALATGSIQRLLDWLQRTGQPSTINLG